MSSSYGLIVDKHMLQIHINRMRSELNAMYKSKSVMIYFLCAIGEVGQVYRDT